MMDEKKCPHCGIEHDIAKLRRNGEWLDITVRRQLDAIRAGRNAIYEECLRLLDPAPDGERSRYAAGLVPCLLAGGIAGRIAGLQAEVGGLREAVAKAKIGLTRGSPISIGLAIKAIEAAEAARENM